MIALMIRLPNHPQSLIGALDGRQRQRRPKATIRTAISLDMSQAAVKKMIAEAREKGYITYDQLNTVLPPDQVSPNRSKT